MDPSKIDHSEKTNHSDESSAEAKICYKCQSKIISHVPYKFEGNLFHARCLLCNTCEKRLVGKPFVATDQNQIFCNYQCQQAYHLSKYKPTVAEVQSYPISECWSTTATCGSSVSGSSVSGGSNHRTNGYNNIENFSLNGLLDKMQNHTYLYQQNHPDANQHYHHQGGSYKLPQANQRVTDYPGMYSSMNHSQSFQSEADSMSTVSESSLTSDSSVFDANRQPQKKILKKSNGPRTKHKRRVRWMDKLESFVDNDNGSIDSSSSVSSSGRSYLRSQELASHYFPNGYVDTQRPVDKLTEYPRHQPSQKFFSPPPSQNAHRYSNGLAPSLLPNPQQHQGIYRTYSGSIYNQKQHHQPHHRTGSLDNQYQRNQIRASSYQNLHQNPQASLIPNQTNGSSSSLNESMERVINVPILHLGEVPELNESNPEERESRHLFEFPPVPSERNSTTNVVQQRLNHHSNVPSHSQQQSLMGDSRPTFDSSADGMMQRARSSSDVSNPQSSLTSSNSSSSISSASSFSSFIPVHAKTSSPVHPLNTRTGNYPAPGKLNCVPENDDENDYDHLEDKPISTSHVPTVKDCLQPLHPDNDWYSSDDIDEALSIIEGSTNGDSEDEEERKVPLFPPPVPAKQRRVISPPPVPPKKQVLNSVLAQEVEINDMSVNETIDGLILSPPHKFRCPGSDKPQQTYSRHDPLHSPSSETLMPCDTSLSDSTLSVPEQEVHPEMRMSTQVKYSSWTKSTMDDRIIEGAEDPPQLRLSPTQLPVKQSVGFKPNVLGRNSDQLSTGRHRNVEKLSNGVEKLSMTTSAPFQRHNSVSSKNDNLDRHQLRTERSRTLPKNLNFTKEDKAVLKWYKERPQMKPIIVDTDKEIEEMMAAETTNDRNPAKQRLSSRQSLDSSPNKQQSYGICFGCNKRIDDKSSLVEFASRTYHCACLCCSHCRCMLKGAQIYTVKGVLMCSDDYNRVMATDKQQTEHHSVSRFRRLKKSSRSHSSPSLKSRDDVVISPPIQSFEPHSKKTVV